MTGRQEWNQARVTDCVCEDSGDSITWGKRWRKSESSPSVTCDTIVETRETGDFGRKRIQAQQLKKK